MLQLAHSQFQKNGCLLAYGLHPIKCLSQLCQPAASENPLDVRRLFRGTFPLRHVCIVQWIRIK
jgi:hypothetical protein